MMNKFEVSFFILVSFCSFYCTYAVPEPIEIVKTSY